MTGARSSELYLDLLLRGLARLEELLRAEAEHARQERRRQGLDLAVVVAHVRVVVVAGVADLILRVRQVLLE